MTIQSIQRSVAQNIDIVAENRFFFQAAKDGDLDLVKQLLLSENLNAQDADGKTVLMCAASKGRDAVVRLLLAEGSRLNLNLKNKKNENALQLAAESGHVETMKLLLQARADVNEKDDAGWTAFGSYLNSLNGEEVNIELLKIFIESGLDHSLTDGNGNNPLMLISALSYPAAKRIFMDVQGVYNSEFVSRQNNKGYTALMCTVTAGPDDFISKLLFFGTDLGLVGNDGETAESLAYNGKLYYAAEYLKYCYDWQRSKALSEANALNLAKLPGYNKLHKEDVSIEISEINILNRNHENQGKRVMLNLDANVRIFEMAE